MLLESVKNTNSASKQVLLQHHYLVHQQKKKERTLLNTLPHTALTEDSSSPSQARNNPNQDKNPSSISKATNLSRDILLVNTCSRSGGSGSIGSLRQVSGPSFLPRDGSSAYVGST